MTYQLNADGSVHIRFEPEETAQAVAYFRFVRSRDGVDTVAVDEALAVLEGQLYFATNTKH